MKTVASPARASVHCVLVLAATKRGLTAEQDGAAAQKSAAAISRTVCELSPLSATVSSAAVARREAPVLVRLPPAVVRCLAAAQAPAAPPPPPPAEEEERSLVCAAGESVAEAQTTVRARLERSRWQPLFDQPLRTDGWVRALVTLSASDFERRCSKRCLELAAQWLLYFDSPLDALTPAALAPVKAALQNVFWVSNNPARKMATWMFGCYLEHVRRLESEPTTTARLRAVPGAAVGAAAGAGAAVLWGAERRSLRRTLWQYAAKHLPALPSPDSESLRPTPTPFAARTGRLAGGRWTGGSQTLSASDFARRVNGPNAVRGFFTNIGAAALKDERETSRCLRALFTDTQLAAMHTLRSPAADDLGPAGDPGLVALRRCRKDYLELAAIICMFVHSPFGALREDLRARLAAELARVSGGGGKVKGSGKGGKGSGKGGKVKSRARGEWDARAPVLDVWATAVLLCRAAPDTAVLKRFCREHLGYVTSSKSAWRFECFNIGRMYLARYNRLRFTHGPAELDGRLVNAHTEYVTLKDFALINTGRNNRRAAPTNDPAKPLPATCAATDLPDPATDVENPAAGLVDPVTGLVGCTRESSRRATRSGATQSGASQSGASQSGAGEEAQGPPLKKLRVDGGRSVEQSEPSRVALVRVLQRCCRAQELELPDDCWTKGLPPVVALATLDLLRACGSDGPFVISEKQVPEVMKYLEGVVRDEPDWENELGQMYSLAIRPATSSWKHWLVTAHLLDHLQIQPRLVAELMLGWWPWPKIEKALAAVSPAARDRLAIPAHRPRDTLTQLLADARRNGYARLRHDWRMCKRTQRLARTLAHFSIADPNPNNVDPLDLSHRSQIL
ncbi:hypothetical protein GNI_109230 [Gregarina niphandrodes]|uniref:Uncharacterized protein n=1 Tax=Gregarina niphandrodes TaxID=110365 RepID=A0A023B3Q2_GRENI|nr:hypothetical protein GNI_109230 [Gregarina niphandrodes]EZG55724.1 hypothetical protein GNI_109230 [Gregarina niphandrodes]|eukprot:XP_011131452.1 hypothetical protein GNI_109230 [Gregarina niphandrodes]